MKLEKSKLFKRIMAYVLVICIMFSMEPIVFADGETTAAIPDLLEPVNLGPAITTSASPTEWTLRTTVDGKDYLITPLRGSQLVVYDLDAYKENPTNDAAVNVDVVETGINVPRGIVEYDGDIYVCGEGGGFLFKYDPVTKDGEKIVIQNLLGQGFQYMDLRDITKDDEGNLYIAADHYGIIKYDTKENTAKVLYDNSTQLCFTLIYDNGYIYCGIGGAVIKVNASTGALVATGDYSAISTSRLFYLSVVDGIVFGGGASGAKKMVAFDADTMQLVNVGIDGHIMGIVTPERNGKHYFVVDGVGLCEYDRVTNQATKYMDFNKYLTCRDAFIKVDERDCIITCNSGFNVRVLDLVTKETKTWEDLTDNVNSKIELRSVASGVPGSDLIWIGGYQNPNVSSYNTETQKLSSKVFSSGYAQTDTILAYKGKLYMGAYYGAYLVEYDPVNDVVRQLSGGMGTTFNQNRMHALAAGDGKIFFSTIPDSSFGSIIGWYELETDTLYVASGLGQLNDGTYEEKLFHAKREDLVRSDYFDTEEEIWTDEDGDTYTPSQLKAWALADKAYNFVPGTEGYTDPKVDVPYGLKGIVYYQEVINLAYHDGYLYCTTSTAGGIGYNQGDARKQEEAVLMVYDVNNGQKAGEFFVTTGHENVEGGIEGLTTPNYIAGVAAGNGKLWGQVSGTLFSFNYDAANGKLTVEEELSFGKTEYPIAGTRHLCPTPIIFDDQGYMYVSFSSRGICQINCNDTSDNRRLTTSDTLGYALGEDGNLYYIHGYDLYKVAVTDVAKVEQLINAIGTVTLESSEAITAARMAYNALSVEDKAKVNNYLTLQNAEIAFDALSSVHTAEVTVKYDFFNTIVATGDPDSYGYSRAPMSGAGNLAAWNAAYEAGTINNVYAGHYAEKDPTAVPSITDDNNTWKGIMYWSFKEDWVALKIKSPGDGEFNMSLDYYQNPNNVTEASVYILPGDTTNISEALALDTTVAQAKVNLYVGSGHQTVSIGKAEFKETDEDYIIVFKCTDSRHGDNTARMYLTGLKMSAYFETLAEAQQMAGNSPFHSAKLLYDEEASAVKTQIEAIGTVTRNSETAIEAARAAYEALNEDQQALVTNLQTLVEAEAKLAELKLSDIDRAEVTVRYDFFNTLVPTGNPDAYGYAKLNLLLTAGNYVNTWKPAYGAGTINNVYADHYSSATANYPGITSLYNDSGDNLWNGIYYTALKGDWIALKIKSPGEGDFNMSLDYYQNGNNATEASIYILPGNTENISDALNTAVAQAKVNLYKGSGHQTVSIEEATFEAGKEYILVFKSTGSRFSDGTARMHLTGLTMTTQLPTLEDALEMAGDSSFHTVKLLSDEAAEAVVSSITAIGEVTLGSEDKITAAKAAYAALNKYQQALVTNLQTLVDAEAALAELKANIIGYIAEISALSNVVNKGEQVSVNVSVNHQAAEGQEPETGFNAGQITVSYDSTKLTFNKEASTLGDATVDISGGVLKLADCGEDKNFATDVYVLVFDAIETGEASVKLTEAAFSNKADAEIEDLAKATLGHTEVAVTIKAVHEVTLPEGFTGTSIVEDGEDYTFEADDKNYEYTFTATVGGQTVTVTDNCDGTYTVASVNGDLVISVADKNGKSYGVTFEGTGKDDMTGAATATYGTDYTFTLPTVEGSLYDVEGITIGGTAYTGYSVSEKTYTISGSAITGNVVITVTKESAPVTNVTVTVEGNGAGVAAGYVNTAVKNQAYTLTIAPESGYSYQVSATMGGVEVANMTVDGNAYTIPNVTGDIVFTITASVITDGVSVSEYLTLNGTKMWLVKNTTELANGKVSTYGDASMFWSEEYDAYCYLVVADDLQTDAAKALVGIKEGTAATVNYGMDVNITGKVDASDAQLVYNMYNAEYESFNDRVTMEKFLRADVTADQKIDVNDAAAIIASILGIASN